MTTWECLDGNEAAARIAYALSEVIAIYPITPASPMGEYADAWAAAGRPNHWGSVPEVIEMESEAGAAGALHGAIQKGALGTTFTSSQGLLLMIPNMFKIAGELTPTVIHVAARSIATHALSIFGDHSDAMVARPTGFALLASTSVQEAHDLALVSHAATLESRIPFLHFFDGFRTSHEMNKIQLLGEEDLAALISPERVVDHRLRGLSPDRPVLRGSAQNPDVFFQAREAANPFYEVLPGIIQDTMDKFASRTGRSYHLVDYHGAPDAERVVVIMGSGAGAVQEAVDAMVARGEPVGMVNVRLFRPFPAEQLVGALPESVRGIAVLDRVKEPGALGEPLYQDVITSLVEQERPVPRVIGGRFGLASKEFTPSMAKSVFDELETATPKRHFTVGIYDDVTRLSLPVDPDAVPEPEGVGAVFYGLGSDGTVGANKMSVKLVGEETELFAQGYFVYDSKKSGSVTVSHLRFSEKPITSTYLVQKANFVGCHQWNFLERMDVLGGAAEGATFLLNSPYGPEEVWDKLPREAQEQIIEKHLDFYVIDGYGVARELGMGSHINTVMQPCFFKLSSILPQDQAIAKLKDLIAKTYGRRGRAVIEQNVAAVDRALEEVRRVNVPAEATSTISRRPTTVEGDGRDFVERVTARLMANEGDLLPVSALPVDGTFPTHTAQYEKRQIAQDIPIWDADICIDCAKCAIVCPHATIRMKVYDPGALDGAPDNFLFKDFRSKDLPGQKLTIQVVPDDCTGCGVCVDVCPAHSKSEVKHKAINMMSALEHRDEERVRWDFFKQIPEIDRTLLPQDTLKGSQVLEPLFEFSGACAGCGETPYLKVMSQLFGDRAIIANATGCSSIYGGNLPTTPWATNAAGRGPAWSNSLFEDNAEFGLGFRIATDAQNALARHLLTQFAPMVGEDLARSILDASQVGEAQVDAQRQRVAELKQRLIELGDKGGEQVGQLLAVADDLVHRSIWIVGGDGWAYDIGFGGLDHVMASGRNVNILVLDTEVYSNTGGQASKATPRGAVAKFASSGKTVPKKDLGMVAMAYGNVYVAQVAMGGNDIQTVKALMEAEAWPGPSLIIAYSTCIAHAIDMATSMGHQKDAVRSGYWPLYRFHPGVGEHERPFQLDSKAPSIPLKQFAMEEGRFAMLARSKPEEAERLFALAQADVDERWRFYSQLAGVERTVPHEEVEA